MTEKFLLLAFAIILLLVSAIWNVFSVKSQSKRINASLVIGKVLFGIVTLLVSVFLIIDIYANPITKSVQLAEDIEVTIDDNKLDSEAIM